MKIAIVGLNSISKRYYNDLRRSRYFDLVGICKNGENLTQIDNINTQFFDNLDDLFSAKIPEAIVIATSANKHKEVFLQCIKYSKNFLIHAPLGQNVDEICQIAQIAKQSHINVCVGYSERFNPVVISLKNELQRESEIYSISAIRADCERCNDGVNLSQSIHDIDLIRYITNSEISEFEYSMNSGDNGSANLFCAKLKTTNGVFATIINSHMYPNERKYMEISCSSGYYMVDFGALNLRKIDKRGLINLRVENEDLSIRLQNEQFYKFCLNPSGSKLCKIEDSLKIAKVFE